MLPVPPKSDFICSPAEVSKHRKVKLKSKPVKEDTEDTEKQTLLPWTLTPETTHPHLPKTLYTSSETL